MKAGEMMLIFGVGIFATRLAMGQTVANVDDLTSTLEPTETATDESSSGTAELREGYDHKDHYGKMGENCDDHDRKHDHGNDYGEYLNSYCYGGCYPSYGSDYNDSSCGYGYGGGFYYGMAFYNNKNRF
ncbi:hypothetical protein PC116_g16004 [Phytophthora cactorum]|uniref:Uncharacterized protein n=1 Tax=Phytophthora cactorum TaxID=29920 RepID=A0A8T1BD55_9STRA|nr:hypothetical protein PC117_g22032 [Phytophthora cactorum]KAG2912386.1 hypothetical protein PC115_g12319 [Phytophthora cactorum]KAG2997051.1 hypothetical protein PC120_g21358 [Phytophthora cactorum]KAG3047389.1 hypothetical protein PC121_g20092 [Phytophthora cactorum]KAG3160079.1 hypothetical protein C6341_g13924 [Phytophthora cactorum]